MKGGEDMKRILVVILTAIMLFAMSAPALADVWVNGYFRSNGTYVQGYWRSSPNAYKYDNYSWNWDTWDGDYRSLYNESYFYPTKNYSSDWYTPYLYQSFYNYDNNYLDSTYDFDWSYDSDWLYDFDQ